jgi:hypothetical protein
MEHVKNLLNRKNVVILLLVFLVLSTVLNVYQYLGYLDSAKSSYVYTTSAWISDDILGMGGISIFLNKGLVVYPDEKFNISVFIKAWEPYVGERTWNISFSLHNRALYDEYSDTPIAEKNITMHKNKDAMTASGSSGPFTLTAPSTFGIWIYRVSTGVPKTSGYSLEFPLVVSPSSGWIPITLPIQNN